tara:strand:+ start:210 stop:815 length:606 start_codon:yes stop_codon:yes gene_type:complete
MNIRLIKFKVCLSINKLISLILVIILFPACQLYNADNYEATFAANTVNYGQYYLALKKLSESDLLLEIKQQKIKKTRGSLEAEINLLLLYSLPNSPIQSSYSTKSQLNEQLNEQLKQHTNSLFSSTDQAFVTLLKDQLNQQLYLFQQLIEQEIESNKQSAKHLVNQKYQNNKNAELTLKINELTNQINQLKKIEQVINEHG